MNTSERASASLYSLVILLGLCIIAGAILFDVVATRALRKRTETLADARVACDEVVTAWIRLYARGAGEADSRFGEAERFEGEGGMAAKVEDISSKFNVNWVDSAFLAQPLLLPLFAQGSGPEAFAALRREKGFTTDIRGSYGETLAPEMIDESFTTYGYADLNTSDAESLTRLYAERSGGRAAPASFADRVRDERRATHAIESAELKTLLAPNYDELFPILSVAPPINVNFAPSRVLLAVLSYPPYGLPDPASRLELIERERAAGEITRNRLFSLIGLARENPIYRRLGVRTWFWRISVDSRDLSLVAVIARLPPDPDHELADLANPTLRIVERRFSR
jgi:hypothetical protein